jgi:hypothetical protein
VPYLFKARTEEPDKQPLLGNGSANPPLAIRCLSKRHVIVATDRHAIMEEMFSVQSVPRLYNEDQL